MPNAASISERNSRTVDVAVFSACLLCLGTLAACATTASELTSLREYPRLSARPNEGPRPPRSAGDGILAGVVFARPGTPAPVPTAAASTPTNEQLPTASSTATLRVRKVGTRSCRVSVGKTRVGAVPVVYEMPIGRHRVVVTCGKKPVVNQWLVFDAGDVAELEVM